MMRVEDLLRYAAVTSLLLVTMMVSACGGDTNAARAERGTSGAPPPNMSLANYVNPEAAGSTAAAALTPQELCDGYSAWSVGCFGDDFTAGDDCVQNFTENCSQADRVIVGGYLDCLVAAECTEAGVGACEGTMSGLSDQCADGGDSDGDETTVDTSPPGEPEPTPDGTEPDAGDGTDSGDPDDMTFTCPDGETEITLMDMCDGENDCPDGWDESIC